MWGQCGRQLLLILAHTCSLSGLWVHPGETDSDLEGGVLPPAGLTSATAPGLAPDSLDQQRDPSSGTGGPTGPAVVLAGPAQPQTEGKLHSGCGDFSHTELQGPVWSGPWGLASWGPHLPQGLLGRNKQFFRSRTKDGASPRKEEACLQRDDPARAPWGGREGLGQESFVPLSKVATPSCPTSSLLHPLLGLRPPLGQDPSWTQEGGRLPKNQ